jgi:hypothetical protein
MAGLAVQPNIEQQIMMLSRTLISRPNLEKLIRMADLDLNVKNKAQQEALIDDLTSSLKILGVGRDNLYTISYRDPDPAKAQKVVQALVSILSSPVWVTSARTPTPPENSSTSRFATMKRNCRKPKIA